MNVLQHYFHSVGPAPRAGRNTIGIAITVYIFSLCLFIFLIPCLACADITWEEEVVTTRPILNDPDHPQIEKSWLKVWLKGKMMRMETPQKIIIFRLSEQVSWHLDKQRNTLLEVPLEKMRRMLYDIFERMRQQIATAWKEEYRQQLMKDMETLFPSGAPEDLRGFEVKWFDQREMVKDMNCLIVRLSIDQFNAVVWIADEIKLPPDFYAFYHDLRILFGGLPKQRALTSVAEAVLLTHGFPMRIILRDGPLNEVVTSCSEVHAIVRRPIDSSLFEKPRGCILLSGLESEAQIQEAVLGAAKK